MSQDTILIVDDEIQFTKLLQSILQQHYTIVTANSGKQAISLLNSHFVKLILLDISMPEMDGFQTYRHIKKQTQYQHIPIIFLTAEEEPSTAIKGLSYGAADYIAKPFSAAIIKARVNTHLNLVNTSTELEQHNTELEKLVSQRTVELTREIAEKQKVYEKLHYLANYDQLTLLPNRNLFNERLTYAFKQAKRNQHPFCLLLIDLDRFKHVNDSLGHHIGDLLLEQVGRRLSACLRGVDTVARLGGDEFTVTLTDLSQKEDAAIVADKIINELARPFEIHKQIIHIGCSIGITTFPDDCDDMHSMLKNADMAMYEVKEKGKNGYAFFSNDMMQHANYRMALEKDLYSALQNNELFLYYQPIYHAQTQKLSSLEALLRWRHPKYGMVKPEKIISIAEESDLIFKLGEWILQHACTQFGIWLSRAQQSFGLSINISSRQFNRKNDNVKLLHTLMLKHNIPHQCLMLEITESMMLEDSKFILDTLSELKRLGIILAIDDFGTGYSSLSYLQKFPIDILKIDQSFVRDLSHNSGNDTLIKAIIAMGKSLNLRIIAEGVENHQQLEFLVQQQCDQAQGYHFSRPLSSEQTSRLLLDTGKIK